MLTQSQAQVEVVELHGRIDASNSDTVRLVVKEALRYGARFILIDCKQVKSIDSAGLSVLIVALKLSRASGSQLCLCSVSDRMKMLLQLTGLERVFDTFQNRLEFERSVVRLC